EQEADRDRAQVERELVRLEAIAEPGGGHPRTLPADLTRRPGPRASMSAITLSPGDDGADLGFIQAFKGAVGGVLAAQWKDLLASPHGLPQTAALRPAVPQGPDAGRGSNPRGSQNIISNGSKILVPRGYGLITVVDGRATGLITEAGGYE